MGNNGILIPNREEINERLLHLAENLQLDVFLDNLAGLLLHYLGPGRCIVLLAEDSLWQIVLDQITYIDGAATSSGPLQDELKPFSASEVSVTDSDPTEILEALIRSPDSNPPSTIFAAPLHHKGSPFAVIMVVTHGSSSKNIGQRKTWRYLQEKVSPFFANAVQFHKLHNQKNTLKQSDKHPETTAIYPQNTDTLSSLGRLSASIAHEFGNPLLGIKFLLADLARSRSLSKQRRKMIDIGLDECNRLQAMIRKLRHEQQPATVLFMPLGTVTLLKLAIEEFTPIFSRNNINLRVRTPEDDPVIMGIQRQLLQVFQNLIRNGVEALQDTHQPTLELSVTTNNQNVCVGITDNGRGMDESVCRKIFEPFFSTKPDVAGAGLGLFVSYWIIAGHNGSIRVDSAPDEGTTFTVTLPLLKGDPE